MLKLPEDIELSNRSLGYLRKWQETIDGEPDYESQIIKADQTWGKSNKTFDEIKAKLRLMSNETERCNYCEDSHADEIEHIYPKNIYPNRTFVWENYLYACGGCNGPKNNQFALINGQNELIDITPPRPKPDNYVPVEPPNLPIALLDPREEDPTMYLRLDITDTFRYVPQYDLDERGTVKAEYTIKILTLNEREYLCKARKSAYGHLKARLREYILEKQNGKTQEELQEFVNGILTENHVTVWHEMKRLQKNIPELTELFNEAPEALNW